MVDIIFLVLLLTVTDPLLFDVHYKKGGLWSHTFQIWNFGWTFEVAELLASCDAGTGALPQVDVVGAVVLPRVSLLLLGPGMVPVRS
jgi:hypothetical protein